MVETAPKEAALNEFTTAHLTTSHDFTSYPAHPSIAASNLCCIVRVLRVRVLRHCRYAQIDIISPDRQRECESAEGEYQK